MLEHADAARALCGACGSTFVEMETLASEYAPVFSLVHAAMSVIPIDPLACTVCATPMRRASISTPRGDVRIDWCGAHGVWFDAGELEELARSARG
jgi:hypothetical protein